jgi:cytochrome b involved in lipid metabolism
MNKTTKIALSAVVILAIAAGIYFSTKKDSSIQYDIPSGNMAQATTTYTLADVAAHSTPTDCWIAVNGNVLNVTEFIAQGLHPNDKIKNGCGKDATAMFEAVKKHDGGKAQAALQQYQIGILQ